MPLLKAECNERQKHSTRMKKKKELEWSISHVKVSSGNKLQGKINTEKKKKTLMIILGKKNHKIKPIYWKRRKYNLTKWETKYKNPKIF